MPYVAKYVKKSLPHIAVWDTRTPVRNRDFVLAKKMFEKFLEWKNLFEQALSKVFSGKRRE